MDLFVTQVSRDGRQSPAPKQSVTVDPTENSTGCGCLCFGKAPSSRKRDPEESDTQLAPVTLKERPKDGFLLPALPAEQKHKKCLVLDLDETLVHSSFQPIPNADFVLNVVLNNVIHHVYVRKRPGVDDFLRFCGQHYEVVIFTASLAKYADPLVDILDIHRVVTARLFRESCVYHFGNFVKDLRRLGRDLENVIILDNSPFSYMFQPDNAIPITSWFDEDNDNELTLLTPLLAELKEENDVTTVLARKQFTHMRSSGQQPTAV